MKKIIAMALGVLLAVSLVTGCGGKSQPSAAPETAAAAENAAAGSAEKAAGSQTYRLIEYEASGYVIKGAELKDNGMDGNTYAELASDGTGVVCIMGAANNITWDDSGSIKINNYPVYTFTRIDDETIAIQMSTSKFTLSSNAEVLAAAETDGAKDDEDAEESRPAGDFSGEKKVYTFAGLEAGGVLQDSVQSFMNTGGAYEDTSLVLNGDGTGSLFMEGSEHEVLWENGRYELQDLMNCSLEEVEDGMYEFDLYGMMKMKLMAEDYTNLKADRSNLKTVPYGSYNGEYGSAGYINAANTVMVSIFVNDDTFGWTDETYDLEEKEKVLKASKVAADWLSDKCALYGYDSTFIYDWTEDPDLAVDGYIEGVTLQGADISGSIDSSNDAAMETLVKQASANEKKLKERYKADNVVYILHINDGGINATNESGRDYAVTSKGREYLAEFGSTADNQGRAAAIAHETLHLFGAQDFYEMNGPGLITQEYVGHMWDINSKDIMFMSADSFVGINKELGPVTAYYVGLLEEAPEDVVEYGLGKPEKKALVIK